MQRKPWTIGVYVVSDKDNLYQGYLFMEKEKVDRGQGAEKETEDIEAIIKEMATRIAKQMLSNGTKVG